MQITDLIKLDFQEVFPSIIGDLEPKLSIHDLVDTAHEYIINEIQNLKEGVNQEKSELISFLKLMEVADEDLEYDSHIHYKLKRLSEKYPDHKSFKFFVYRYVLSTAYDSDEFSLDQLTFLYKRILDDVSLMQLTDFINESEFGNSILMLNEVSDELVSILEDALSQFPEKITLLWITAQLNRVQGKYQESIRFCKSFFEKLESIKNSNSLENIDTDYVDDESEQMVCYQLADLHFIINDYSNSMYYCDKVLEHDRDKENSSFYYDTLIIRIRIHMVSNNRIAFQEDYDELRKVITEEELKDNYSDILAKQLSFKDL